MPTHYPKYTTGLFVRIRNDFPGKYRAGKDGFIHTDFGDSVLLSFGTDRYSRYQGIPTAPPECWDKRDTQIQSIGYA